MATTKGSDWQHILIASDLHGCYLDRQSYSVFLGVCSSFAWDHCFLNGDVCDFTQLSSHDKKVGKYQRSFQDDFTLDEELHFIRNDIFKPLRKALGKTKITMRLGNHDSRYLSIAENNPSALAELLKTMRKHESIHLEDVLALDKFGIDLSYNAEDTLFDSFTLVHGVKTTKNVAKQNLATYGSGTSGHSHRMGCYTETQRGKVQGWWESGCLRTTKNIEYLPFGSRVDWSQGFLELHINRNGEFHCIPHFIINGRTWMNGQLFSA